MKKVSLDTWIQLIGMLGILGGLVFVGLEMKQSQIIAIGGQIQARNDAIMDFFSSPLDGNETALLLFDRGMTSYEPKNNSEKIVFSQIQRVRAVSLQNAWQQYELGLINSDTFEYSKRRILAMYDTCGIRPFVTSRATNGFLQFLESNSQVQC